MLAVRCRLNLAAAGQGTSLHCLIALLEQSALEENTPLRAGEVSAQRACCYGRVTARRLHGASLLFVDVTPRCGGAPVQVVLEGNALRSDTTGLALRLGSTVLISGHCGRTRRGAFSLFAAGVRLVGVPHDPAAASRVAQACACHRLSTSEAAAALGCPVDRIRELVALLEESEMDTTCAEYTSACRRLMAALRKGGGRLRRPRFSLSELELVGRLCSEHCWMQVERLETLVPLDEASLGALHPSMGVPQCVDDEQAAIRIRYVEQKKVPQLRWMMLRAFQLLDDDVPLTRVRCVVDVGCGKADLGLLLAAALPRVHVVCADNNQSALASARSRAAAAKLTNVSFYQGDLSRQSASVDMGGDTAQIDLVVALHACGGLSDVALDLAALHHASALVCSCCYNKHRSFCPAERWGLEEEQKSVVCRMADSCDQRAADPARRLIGSLRLKLFRTQCMVPSYVALHTFPEKYSSQNFVVLARTDKSRL
ncbi:hypothetical protein AB1Y20_019693 [Prymnesium parvum]|uniref:Methyltransferase domain-containing protein n=1 Tax=Prymnesium parvum TaxID=97485 RepID=A0AB34JV72_PRYPA